MLIGVTSTIPPNEEDDIWSDDVISYEVQFNDIEVSLNELAVKIESNVGVVGVNPYSCVKASYLSKFWRIDFEKSQKTINS